MLHYYNLDYATEVKSNEVTPESAIFTEIDGKVDSIVQNYFRQVWPEDQLLTEETKADECWHEAKRIWIIDPIGGGSEVELWAVPLVVVRPLSAGFLVGHGAGPSAGRKYVGGTRAASLSRCA